VATAALAAGACSTRVMLRHWGVCAAGSYRARGAGKKRKPI
jgi:hypothetical protein